MSMSVVLKQHRHVIGRVEVTAFADRQHLRILAGTDYLPKDGLVV
jgi:hypothetical protein